MRVIRFLAASLAGLMLLAGPAMAKDWKMIRIATEADYAPFNYLDAQDQPGGFDVDIAKALCARMQAQCSIEAANWDALIPALNAGKYDAVVSSMAITEDRKRQVAFTDKYYDRPSSFAARKDSKITAWDAPGLKDKVIGVQADTVQAAFLKGEIQSGGAQVKLYQTQDEADADLVIGKLDAVFADKILLSNWLSRPDSLCCEVKADADLVRYAKYFGEGEAIALRKNDTDLKEKLNKAIADIVADGTYKTINDKYFPFSIY
ncbi:amino acid ABC transporter [Labrys miyagiensis]|uniref:Amino acid ABC transporter n=1 Tax=Labrys miyagiensis TaxID=346912 RepID=A0ABQ6CQU4_9HYPH|nr:transporter substrate-binding domain-containing protein [Labrys miyagiensis]GLS22163.1 amino acid ABC transporter [Labrys miyagiensis]